MDTRESVDKFDTLPGNLQFVTYHEVAAILKVRPGTVRSWVCKGMLKSSVRIGKGSLIPLSELQRFVIERTKMKGRERSAKRTTKLPPFLVDPRVVEAESGEGRAEPKFEGEPPHPTDGDHAAPEITSPEIPAAEVAEAEQATQ